MNVRMMKKLGAAVVFTTLVAMAGSAQALKVGEAAPAFTATDSNGKQVSLEQFKGKYVVLEWHNEGCPFVVKHYSKGNLPSLQKEWTAKQVVWLSIISSAPGKQGHVDGKGANADVQKHNAAPTATLLDPKGEIGKAYGAKTTPHMFIIDPKGQLIYNGAIDDKPTPNADDIAGAKNYVRQALTEALAGKPVSEPTTTPYGCSVKYP